MKKLELKELRKICTDCKLRPEIKINEPKAYEKSPHHNLYGQTFQMLSFYWAENYFDNLQIQYTKLKALQEALALYITQLNNYASHEFGASDGHLFIIITYKK